MWGVIEVDGAVHVVPLGEDNLPLDPHVPTLDCLCHPDIEEHLKLLIIHNQLQ